MKYSAIIATLAGLSVANPMRSVRSLHNIGKRQVPQEQSHKFILIIVQEFLQLNNPLGIKDPVFGLLGNAAAAEGVEADINLDCLKQFTADQAYSNAKAIGDVRGMSAALLYQGIERNTGKVGLASVICPEDAVNPEIAAFDQHQDAASEGAADINKAIALEIAVQLTLIDSDPLLALESGTFAPGDVNDPTAAGFTCDDPDDDIGCIYTERLLVLDATPEEILAHVAEIKPTFTGTGELRATHIDFDGLPVAEATGVFQIATAPNPEVTTPAIVCPPPPKPTKGQSCSLVTKTVPAAAAATKKAAKQTAAAAATKKVVKQAAAAEPTQVIATNINIQIFAGTLGGAAPPVLNVGGDRPFQVKDATFVGEAAAIARSCDIQHNSCANAANSGSLEGGTGQCEKQLDECKTANSLKMKAKKRQAGKFGSCTDPSILFGVGFDGRKEGSFVPKDNNQFNHGSAQKIGIIASFICQRLKDSCKADKAILDVCDSAASAAVASTQDQAAADVFNSLLLGGDAPAPQAPPAAKVTPAPKKVHAPKKGGRPPPGMIVVTVTECS